jgi:transitional endoplasmic reticulum ATPase
MIGKEMTLEKLEDKCEKHRQNGREFRGSNPRKAAQHLLKAADFADRMADLDERERLSEKRRELALNLRQAAQEEMRSLSQEVETVGVGSDKNDEETTTEDATAESAASGADEASGEDWEYIESTPGLDLEDVGGMDELKQDLRRGIIRPIEYREKAESLGVGINNGVLLEGPPGVGKTYITRALTGELGYPFAEVRASELGSRYVNEGAENVAALFEEAREAAPCVVFLDEIDSLAGNRSDGPQKTNSERKMVTEFLQAMEDIQGTDILVVGATNLVEDVDAAIRRSGRFNQTFHVDAPDPQARKEIFGVHLRDKAVDEASLDTQALVQATDGFTGADIETIIKEAGRAALDEAIQREIEPAIAHRHLMAAIRSKTPSVAQWNQQQGSAS